MGEITVQQANQNEVSTTAVAVRKGFFDATPKEQVEQATEIANVLSSVIEKQGLFSNIQGKKYVKAEGWMLLGTFLGVVPRERSVSRLADGSYEAYVELIRFNDGTIVGGGSAICSRTEKRWASADEYAVRSMAITRATSKSFRLGYSWIVTLAGYQPTPEEEIPVSVTIEVPKLTKEEERVQRLAAILEQNKVPPVLWPTISDRMVGKYPKDLPGVTKQVMEEYRHEQEQMVTTSAN